MDGRSVVFVIAQCFISSMTQIDLIKVESPTNVYELVDSAYQW